MLQKYIHHQELDDHILGTRHVVHDFFMWDRKSKCLILTDLFEATKAILSPFMLTEATIPPVVVASLDDCIGQYMDGYKTYLTQKMLKTRTGRKDQVSDFLSDFAYDSEDITRLAVALRNYKVYASSNILLKLINRCVQKTLKHFYSVLNETQRNLYFHINLMDCNSSAGENHYLMKQYHESRIHYDEVVDLGQHIGKRWIRQNPRYELIIGQSISLALSRISLMECRQGYNNLAERTLLFAKKHVSAENSRNLLVSMVALSKGLANTELHQRAAYWLKSAISIYPKIKVRTDRAHPDLDLFKSKLDTYQEMLIGYQVAHLQKCKTFCIEEGYEFTSDKKQIKIPLGIHSKFVGELEVRIKPRKKYCRVSSQDITIVGVDKIEHSLIIEIAQQAKYILKKHLRFVAKQEREAQKPKHKSDAAASMPCEADFINTAPTASTQIIKALTQKSLLKPKTPTVPKNIVATVLPRKQKQKTRPKVPVKTDVIKTKKRITPAQKLGFDDERFGNQPLIQCRQRGAWQPPFYVSFLDGDSKEKIPTKVLTKFQSVIQNAKIVPPVGEQGLKWKFHDDADATLKVKLLGDFGMWRMEEKFHSRNSQGETAFAYGVAYQKKG